MSERIRTTRLRGNILGDVGTGTDKTQVVAHQTDPYIHPSSERNPLQDVAESTMKSLGAYTELQSLQKADNQKRAANDFASGKASNPNRGVGNLGVGYEATYYGLEGEAKAIELANNFKESLKQQNYFEKSQDPEAEQHALYTKMYQETFGSVGNQDILNGATERLIVGRQEAQNAAQSHFHKRAKENTMNNANVIIKDGMHGILDNPNIPLEDSGVWMSSFIEGVQTESLQGNSLVSPEELTTSTLQSVGINLMELAESSNLDDQAKALMLADSLKDVAVRGNNWYTEKKSDNSFKYKDMIDDIEHQINTTVRNTKKVDEDQLKEDRDKYAKGLYVAMGQILTTSEPKARFKEANRLLTEVRMNADSLEFSKLRTIQDSLTKIAENQGFSEKTNPDVYRDARVGISEGYMTQDQLLAMSSQMTNSDFGSLMSLLEKHQELNGKAPSKSKQFADIVRDARDVLSANGTEVGALEAQNSVARGVHFNTEMHSRLLDYIETYDTYPPRDMMLDWADKVSERAAKRYPRLVRVEDDVAPFDPANGSTRSGDRKANNRTPNPATSEEETLQQGAW